MIDDIETFFKEVIEFQLEERGYGYYISDSTIEYLYEVSTDLFNNEPDERMTDSEALDYYKSAILENLDSSAFSDDLIEFEIVEGESLDWEAVIDDILDIILNARDIIIDENEEE
jgi:hypothetical protein